MQFTRLALLMLATSYLMNTPILGGVAIATQWGVVCSFTFAPLLDATVYARMRQKHRWSRRQFYIGHIMLHILPLCVAVLTLPRPNWIQSCTAVLIHSSWFALADVNRLYVHLPHTTWRRLFAVAVLAELACARSFFLP